MSYRPTSENTSSRTFVNKGKKKGRSPENAGPSPMPSYPARRVGGSVYLAEDEHLFVGVPVDGVRVVDEVPQDLGVVGGGHNEGLLGTVVEDQLVGELAVLQWALAAPVGVDVGDLTNLYRPFGVLLAQGEPPRVGFVDEVLLTRPTPRLTPTNFRKPLTGEVRN